VDKCKPLVSGTLLTLPLLLSQTSGALVTAESIAGTAISCLLFGVVYRYAMRDDVSNNQLKVWTSLRRSPRHPSQLQTLGLIKLHVIHIYILDH